jgi:hypothetical protein
MTDERKLQDQAQDEIKDEVKKSEESSKELSEEQLDNVAAGGTTRENSIECLFYKDAFTTGRG